MLQLNQCISTPLLTIPKIYMILLISGIDIMLVRKRHKKSKNLINMKKTI